jgi:uncharacterized protein
VIADVHLGYEWARAAAGDCVPAHSFDETVARLSAVLTRFTIARLVVAGDLVESARPCRRTTDDVRRLRDWIASRGVNLLVLEGNHDSHRGARHVSGDAGAMLPVLEIDGWTIAHGHQPVSGERTMSGHHHPVLRFDRRAAPCFLAGPHRIVLPAFSANAAGCDVLAGPIPGSWLDETLHCIVSTGSELLDFGPLPALRRARGSARWASSRMPGLPSAGRKVD